MRKLASNSYVAGNSYDKACASMWHVAASHKLVAATRCTN